MISTRSYLGAIAVIAILMTVSYIAALVIPCDGIPVWRFILSPILVLGAEGNGTLIAVLVFLLIIGGIFNALDKCGLMRFMLDFIANKFADSRYKLMAVLMLFFMAMGSLIGSFEECVPLIPICVALAIKLGWDAITGMAMCLLAVGCGFAAGVFNPFTVGVAQELAGLPMFSGAWFRAVAFVCIYLLLLFFVRRHAKKIDRGVRLCRSEQSDQKEELCGNHIADNYGQAPDEGSDAVSFTEDKQLSRALLLFGGILGAGILLVLLSSVITALQDYTLIIVALAFLIAGIVSGKAGGMSWKFFGSTMWAGVVSMLPAVLMILMASSIKYIMETAGILNILLGKAVELAATLPAWKLILFIYLMVLVLNFFIASGSAKAIMLMPLIVPLAAAFGLSTQLCVVAYAFGDGFSNVFYPTNPALLIGLGLADVNYVDWFKWSWKFQLSNLVLTSALLLLGLAVGL